MIDSNPFDIDPIPQPAGQPDGNIADQPTVSAPRSTSHTLLWVILFLLACMAGALGTALTARAGLL
ncbi:hypothetical protein [Sphingomonas sp. RT2P30]|uniref:hypothetical protein n=1 Tax=Parasphingomonas halimpatiens TaxID=3096162 RepID=UPI002FCAA94D